MRRPVSLAALSIATSLCAACTSGEYRRVPLTRDLPPGDLIHYQNLAEAKGAGSSRIEDFRLGFPFWPVFCGTRETTADRREDGPTHFHVEDDDGFLLYLLAASTTTANFDPEGRNVDWTDTDSIVLGAFRSTRGAHVTPDGRVERSGFQLLWGLFGTSSEAGKRSWKVLWIPL